MRVVPGLYHSVNPIALLRYPDVYASSSAARRSGGGSTVILVAPAGALAFDADLVAHSAAGLETRVLCCERIATWERG